MLADDIKQRIQTAYSEFLNNRQLQARYGQKLMIAHIAKTLGAIDFGDEGERLSQRHVAVIEAGTGTGKTVAYLLAMLPLAKALGKHLVISTATVALQEQLVYKDIPELKQHSGLDFTFALAKGRGRYLCLAKMDRLLNGASTGQENLFGGDFSQAEEFAPTDEQSVRIYESMMEALAKNKWDGDKDNWPDAIEDRQWLPLTATHRQCTGRRCSFVKQCSFLNSRDQLRGVDCVITNHDLVLSDLALGGGAILPSPEKTFYVFDEGHHLSDKALNHFSNYTRVISTERWLNDCVTALSHMSQEWGGEAQLLRLIEPLPHSFTQCAEQLKNSQLLLRQLLERGDEEEGYNQRRFSSNRHRFAHGQVPEVLQTLAHDCAQLFNQLVTQLTHLSDELNALLDDGFSEVPKVDLEAAAPVVGAWLARAEGNLSLWLSYSLADNESALPTARWLEKLEFNSGEDIALSSSPILAAQVLDDLLWSQCAGAVLTSATLTALGRFDRLRQRTGLNEDQCYEVVPSPFDYSRVELWIPHNAEDAGQAERHTESLIDAFPELLSISQGTLVLFASRRQMNEVYDALPLDWQQRILQQDEQSKQETLRLHKEAVDAGEASVLFGLASFAEGVDLPGEYCQHVIIAKIPFAVPDDPIDAALAEWIEDRGGNSFMEISVPDASLKLIQACGRLMRTEKDSGRITIMDKRLETRRYGKALLNALPGYRRIQ